MTYPPYVLTPRTVVSWCAPCSAFRLFEDLPCADRHGTDCPERVCVACGAAVVIAVYVGDDGVGTRRAA